MIGHRVTPGEGRRAVIELKAAGFTLPVIRLLEADMDAVAAELGARVEQAPDFFRNTPVVIDLNGVSEGSGEIQFPSLVGLLRGYGMIPFGVRGGTKAQQAAAEAMELAILAERDTRRVRDERPSEPAAPPAPAAPQPASRATGPALNETEAPKGSGSGFNLVARPVRSGQRVYAADGDLCVIGPVSSGAELMAEGNIHVYGPLRGRALAGMKGNTNARIFCQGLEAELVSIAGHYRVSENIPAELHGKPVQIYLDHKIIRIEKL
jgi:septum site-determining protein MinC